MVPKLHAVDGETAGLGGAETEGGWDECRGQGLSVPRGNVEESSRPSGSGGAGLGFPVMWGGQVTLQATSRL